VLRLHSQGAACVRGRGRGCRWKESIPWLMSLQPFKPIVILLWLHCVMTLFSGAIYPREKKTLL
jgi:hypothetical protein